MSFLSVLKAIGHGVEIGVTDATAFAPIISAIPKVGAPINAVIGAISAAEQLIPNSSGTAKKTVATTVVNATVPGLDPQALSTAIDAIVAAFNAIQMAMNKIPPPVTKA